MKEAGTSHWKSPNTGATNESGFSGLAGGRISHSGTFYDIGEFGWWWTSTVGTTSSARVWGLNYNNFEVIGPPAEYYVDSGLSVRCIKE